MKEVGNYGPTPSERKNGVHENNVCGSSSGSVEVPVISDDFWDSLEISDESSLDGEVGKRLNQMVPIPVSVPLVQPLDFVLKSSCFTFTIIFYCISCHLICVFFWMISGKFHGENFIMCKI